MFRRRQAFDPLQPDLVAIAAGRFVMGTAPDEVRALSRQAEGERAEWYGYEQPLHEVDLPAYAIGRYPVTVGEFAAFIKAGGYERPELWSAVGWGWRTSYRVSTPAYWEEQNGRGRAQFPVVGISWYTAQAYCAWLREETGQPFRLPAEAEWEKAARGPEGWRYPWGQQWQRKRCNTAGQELLSWDGRRFPGSLNGHLTPVGAFSPGGDSPYGCADMVGNVWEWCGTPLRRYPLPARPYDRTPDLHDQMAVRGGSWYHGPEDARCAARYGYYPHGRDTAVGLRLAL